MSDLMILTVLTGMLLSLIIVIFLAAMGIKCYSIGVMTYIICLAIKEFSKKKPITANLPVFLSGLDIV